MKTRSASALGLSLLLLLAGGGTAHAARGLTTGFGDGLYQSADPATRSLWLDRTVQSDGGLVRMNLSWRAAAPSRPADPSNPGSSAYRFGTLDAAVRDARARGLAVVITIIGAPSWAEGQGRPAWAPTGTWKPSPGALAAFARAVAARYSGAFDPDGTGHAPPLPAAQALQVWNEPNLPEYLTPQYEGGAPVSPDHYRTMLNASYAAVKAVNPAMLVVTAGTAPYGDASGGSRVRPVAFYRRLLCARQHRKKGKKKGKRRARLRFTRAAACGPAAQFDVLAHHPINTSGAPTRHAINRDDASSADLLRITRVLRAAERLGTVTGHHPIWVTEMWWDSRPPSPVGSPLGRHARWVEQALYLLWRDGASAVLNLRIRDASGPPEGLLDGSQSGIFFAGGGAKPAVRAFSFPFVTQRLRHGRLRAWGKAPAGGRLVIQRRHRGRWRAVRKLGVRRGAVFAVKLRLRGRQRLRAKVAGVQSLVWRQR